MNYALPKLEIPILSEHLMSFYISVPLLMLFLWPEMLFPPFPIEQSYFSLHIQLTYGLFGKHFSDSTIKKIILSFFCIVYY